MATRDLETIADGTPLEEFPDLPPGWRAVEEENRRYLSDAEWKHEETGLSVVVRHQRRPTQMHTPETSRDDTGFKAIVHGNESEQITHNLSSKIVAYRRAYELMINFPEGDFEPEWQDIEWDGPRDVCEWIE